MGRSLFPPLGVLFIPLNIDCHCIGMRTGVYKRVDSAVCVESGCKDAIGV